MTASSGVACPGPLDAGPPDFIPDFGTGPLEDEDEEDVDDDVADLRAATSSTGDIGKRVLNRVIG